MQLYTQHKSKLSSLKEKPFKLEKEIQQLFEANLENITGWKFIKSEFSIKANRIDTLAYDEENNSFVIIEYKRERSYSVVDQGVSYLNLMLENRADFIVEYNESQSGNLKRNDVDWSQSKVVFVSPSFTSFQKQASNFKDLPIELWEIKQYTNDIIVVNPIKKSKSAPAIKEVQSDQDSQIAKVAKEIIVYSEESHLEGKSDDIIELFEAFKASILNLSGDIEIVPKKMYIAFKLKNNIVDIRVQQKNLILWINMKKGTLEDSKMLTIDASTKGHYGNGDYELAVSNTDNLEYIMSLVKQAL
ncbi:endonuclease NucS domain-containing protein [Myroides phaeus]|uniref:Predicted transport protein n=1 Tax=Myroides phaeus TaxID=702745 RepID=A0A1G8DK89_9FLAO|nr:endonuclease NucS domain-containing protein [Myroides phaeus]SDH58075.1 Predicted transport protein [Myroides phaeus]